MPDNKKQNTHTLKKDSGLKSEAIKDIVKQSPMQYVFVVTSFLAVAQMIPWTISAKNFIDESYKNKPSDYEFPVFSDMKIPLASSLVFYGLQVFCERMFASLAMPYIKPCKNEPEKEMRAEKVAKYLFRAIYYLVAIIWGYRVLINQPYMPRALGGKGDFSLIWHNYPYQEHAPELKEYILVLLGYNFGGLISHFLHSRKNDFIEMGLHHILAIFLTGGGYLVNGWEGSAIITFIHDLADLTTGLVKAGAETKFKNQTALIFVIHMTIWFYSRMVVFPWVIYTLHVTPVDMGSKYSMPIFNFFLSCLFMLHCYWFKLFCKMLGRFVSSGVAEDIQSKTVVNQIGSNLSEEIKKVK